MLLFVFPPEIRLEIVNGALEQEEVTWVRLTALPTLVIWPWASSDFRNKNMSSEVRRTQVQVPRSTSVLCPEASHSHLCPPPPLSNLHDGGSHSSS